MKQKDIANLGFLTEEERKELLSLLAEYKKQKN